MTIDQEFNRFMERVFYPVSFNDTPRKITKEKLHQALLSDFKKTKNQKTNPDAIAVRRTNVPPYEL